MNTRLVFAYPVHYVSSSTNVDFHYHELYECVLYTKGSGCLHIGDNDYRYEPGTLLILKPNVRHNEIHHMPTVGICLGYEAGDADAEFPDDVTVLNVSRQPHVLEYAQSIINEQIVQNDFYSDVCNALFKVFLINVKRFLSGNIQETASSNNEVVSIYTQAWDPASDTDIVKIWEAQLAEYKDYSYERFRHAFKARMNVSPTKYLLQLRVQKACYLLTTTSMNITGIALSCGFSSCSFFTQQFRKVMGVTPSQYRSRMHNSPTNQIVYVRDQNRENRGGSKRNEE